MSMGERGKRHMERMAGVVERVTPHLGNMAPDALLDRIDEIEKLDKVARRTFGITDGAGSGGNVMVNIAMLGMISPDAMRVTVEADTGD